MYSVSNAYKARIVSEEIQERRIRGLLDDIPFTQADLLSGSLKYTEKCASGADIKLGGVFVGELQLTFLKPFADGIARGTWKNRQIKIWIDLKIGENTWEEVPLKPYFIDSAEHKRDGVSVKAYDAMSRFDKPMTINASDGQLYDFMELACTAAGVTNGMTQAQMEDLPNGDEILGIYTNNDMSTWRDLVSWIAATAGGFATINRTGAVEIRNFTATPVFTVNKYNRFAGGSWSDFATRYTGINITDIDSGMSLHYGQTVDDGLAMNIGADPLLQYGTKEIQQRQRMAIVEALEDFDFVPFKSVSLLDPAFDLGDCISYTDGLAGTSSACCIMAMAYQYTKGMTLQGFGKDPALSGAQSKTDKNINGLLSRTNENELITYTFTNAREIELEEETEETIISIRFATINPKVVSIFHEIILDTEATTSGDTVEAEIHYYLDGELISFKPRSSWNNDGPHIIPLMYFLNTLEGGKIYTWEVAIVLKNGTGTIARGEANAILQGQGLVAADTWDGLITAEDQIVAHFGGSMHVTGLTEEVTFTYKDVEKIEATDQITAHFGGSFEVTFSENISVIADKILYIIGSEDENYILGSEDEQYQIESEE